MYVCNSQVAQMRGTSYDIVLGEQIWVCRAVKAGYIAESKPPLDVRPTLRM